MKFRYWIPEEGGWAGDYYTVESTWDKEELEYVAEDCAEDFHSNHDGWDNDWPIEFVIADEAGEVLGTFNVHMEARPEFSAFKKE